MSKLSYFYDNIRCCNTIWIIIECKMDQPEYNFLCMSFFDSGKFYIYTMRLFINIGHCEFTFMVSQFEAVDLSTVHLVFMLFSTFGEMRVRVAETVKHVLLLEEHLTCWITKKIQSFYVHHFYPHPVFKIPLLPLCGVLKALAQLSCLIMSSHQVLSCTE